MQRKKMHPIAPEWSWAIEASGLGRAPVSMTITADKDECAALARRFGLQTIDSLEAEVELTRDSLTVHVTGHVRARVTQTCVITLTPLPREIEAGFEAWYADTDEAVSFVRARRDRMQKKGHAELPILEEHEDPEPIRNGLIDLGELAAQYLSLALEAFPRSEDAPPDDAVAGESEPSEIRKNPFAALKNWKAGGGGAGEH